MLANLRKLPIEINNNFQLSFCTEHRYERHGMIGHRTNIFEYDTTLIILQRDKTLLIVQSDENGIVTEIVPKLLISKSVFPEGSVKKIPKPNSYMLSTHNASYYFTANEPIYTYSQLLHILYTPPMISGLK